MKRLGIVPAQIMLGDSLDESILAMSEVLRNAEALCTSLSAEYVAMDRQYGFWKLYKENFRSMEELLRITPDMLAKKRQYIRYQYYRSFEESREELRRLEAKQESLKNLLEQMELYIKSLDKAIKAYRKQLISQIEIPFFLYSSRLLQSYHGGQGILISTEDDAGADGTERNKVRFIAPGREHDVHYTMSSGQLSAVLLAFTLSLNQIYAGDGFRTMLIDDPIQCMDDINMISLVELLGREFGNTQIILSTHEDTFSRYICYKFGKYRLPNTSVSMKAT
jgi:exonuclease SbcC